LATQRFEIWQHWRQRLTHS